MNFHIFRISLLCGADVVVPKILQQTHGDLFLTFNNMIEAHTLVVQTSMEMRWNSTHIILDSERETQTKKYIFSCCQLTPESPRYMDQKPMRHVFRGGFHKLWIEKDRSEKSFQSIENERANIFKKSCTKNTKDTYPLSINLAELTFSHVVLVALFSFYCV